VLPFVNRSRDEEDEYFADGLADELLNVLAKIRGLRVAARSSAFTFKGKGATVAEVGRALNVATVLEGSVRKAGNRMRISVQLVKVADGYHLWAESYDRTLDDIFAVQDDIALSVVKELRSTLLGETLDPKAGSEATAQVAAAGQGPQLRPGSLPPLLAGAASHRAPDPRRYREGHRVSQGGARPRSRLCARLGRARPRVRQRSQRELGSARRGTGAGARRGDAGARARAELAEAHAELAWIQMLFDWDWRGAEASCARALELAPGMRSCCAGPATWPRYAAGSTTRSRCIGARSSRIR
jgi:TolB-like protein